MFSLIITIISIVLVAALALATIYYGGDSLVQSRERAALSQTLNEGGQVEAAVRLFRVEQGRMPQDMDELVGMDYLRALPVGPGQSAPSTFAFGEDYIYVSVAEASVCEALNARMGIAGPIPMCNDPGIAGLKVCCNTGN